MIITEWVVLGMAEGILLGMDVLWILFEQVCIT